LFIDKHGWRGKEGGLTYLKSERLMMIRVSHVSVVEEPDVPDVEDLVVRASEELLEVFSRLKQVREPDKCGKVTLSTLNELASQLNLLILLLECCLYKD
jgi:hypothetical protein